MSPTLHPDRDPPTQIGTLAGLPVWLWTGYDGPMYARPLQVCGSGEDWIAVGAAPWAQLERRWRLIQWLDPEGSPWSLDDLPDVLVAAGLVGDVRAEDWPEACAARQSADYCAHPDHYGPHLSAALNAAAIRYAALATAAARGAP